MMRSSRQVVPRVLSLCLVLACHGETTTPSAVTWSPAGVDALATDNVVATLSVVPDSQMVFVGDRFQVTAVPKNKAGQVLDRSIAWTVTNTSVITALGSVGPTMAFKALKVGNTSSRATVDGKSRYSKVVVRAVAGAKVVVTPGEATVASGEMVRFAARGLTKTGEAAAVNVTWAATGGTISADGVLTGGDAPGTFQVIATSLFGAADTSSVTVTTSAPPAPVAAVILVPEAVSLSPGGTRQFAAYGRTEAGDSVAVGVTYTATGGTIAGGGLYTAGGAEGTYAVIASSAAGLADTSEVIVVPAAIARVTLVPGIAASRPGATIRFSATAWNTLDEIVSEPVTYQTTCGTVTGTGVFSAPGGQGGSCLVTASAGGQADTTEVVILTSTPSQGIPFGLYDMWPSPTGLRSSGVSAYTASHDYVPPGGLVGHIAEARARGVRLVLAMTGGSHDRYKTAGVFDLAKWQAAMDAFNTPSIQSAVAEGVADGTIIGNSVMDEPQQSGNTSKDWGPPGTMTKVRVDGLCGYVKAIFPTLAVGVGHDHSAFEPGNSYQACDFFMPQYAARKGSVTGWRDAALALAARDGLAVLFSMNLLNGGVQDKSGAWDCAGTGGLGERAPNCQVTPGQLADWGKLLGQAGCAMMSWRYDAAFMGKSENQAAISDVAIALSMLPRTPCGPRPQG